MAEVFLSSKLHVDKLNKLMNLAGESLDQRTYKQLKGGYFQFQAPHMRQDVLNTMVKEGGLALSEKHVVRAKGGK